MVRSGARSPIGISDVILTPLSEISPWKTPIPDEPALHSSSVAIVAKLVSWNSGNPNAIQAGQFGGVNDFAVPVYIASGSDSLFTINNTSDNARSYQIDGTQIRIPAGAIAAAGSDSHIVVIQPDGWVYEFWAVASIAAGTITAAMSGRTRLHGDGFDNANAYASKTAALAGRITTEEWIAAANGEIEYFPHAIAIMTKSTDGTSCWPASGLAGVGDTIDSPQCGSWFQSTYTFGEIEALAIPLVAKAFLKTVVTYGMIVMDTMGNVAGQSWNVRSLGNDTADDAILDETPMTDHAIAQGEPGSWFLDTGIYYFTALADADWTKLRVLSPTYMKAAYDALLAPKKLDPTATLQVNSWSPTGAATIHQALLEATYPPFTADAALRIGTNTVGRICEVRCETLTIPEGKTLTALIGWFYGSVPGSTTQYTFRLKSGASVLASYTIPLANTNPGWFAVAYTGSMASVDLADLRLEFEHVAGTGFTNIYAAHITAEFEAP